MNMSSSSSSTKEQVEYAIVQQGVYGCHAKDVQLQLLQTDKEATAAGLKSDIVSSTDFSQDILIYVASGAKPTGGYSVLIKKVTYDSKKKLLDVYARDKEPKDQFGTMATTQPFTVIRIAKREIEKEKVHWAKKRSSSTSANEDM